MSEPTQHDNLEAAAPPKTPTLRGRAIRGVVTLLILGGGAFGFFKYKQHAKEKEAAAKKASEAKKGPAITLVRVSKSRTSTIQRRERYVGELAALQVVELGPKAAGRLMRVPKQINDPVRKGEVVATVDDLEIRKQIAEADTAVVVAKAQVARADADLLRARAEHARAKVEVLRTRIEADRKRPLFRQQLVTQQEMDNLDAASASARTGALSAKTAVAVAEAAVTVARAQVRQSEARLPLLRVQLDNTRVVVPFDGRVNKRYLEPGAMVAIGTPIYQIVTDEKVLVRFKVPERDLAELPTGKEIDLELEAYPKEKFKGQVVRVAPAVDVQTRTVTCEAETDALDGKLKPGMFARVEVLWSVLENVVLAPQRALVRPPDDPQGQPGLYLMEGGRARFVRVQAGLEKGEDVEVRGIASGADVIIEGQHGLRAGVVVALAQENRPPGVPAKPELPANLAPAPPENAPPSAPANPPPAKASAPSAPAPGTPAPAVPPTSPPAPKEGAPAPSKG